MLAWNAEEQAGISNACRLLQRRLSKTFIDRRLSEKVRERVGEGERERERVGEGERERERERDRETERERERDRERTQFTPHDVSLLKYPINGIRENGGGDWAPRSGPG